MDTASMLPLTREVQRKHFPAREVALQLRLDSLRGVLNGQSMPKSHFQESRQALNSALRTAWDGLILEPYFHGRRWEALDEEARKVSMHSLAPEIHTVKSYLRRIEALDTSAPVKAEALALLKEWLPVVDLVEQVKPLVGRPAAPAQKKTTESSNYLGPLAKPADVARVRALFEEVTRQVYDESVRRTREYLRQRLEAVFGIASEMTRKEFSAAVRQEGGPRIMRIISPLLHYPVRDGLQRVAVRPDAEAVIAQMAEEQVKAQQEAFIEKNLAKVAYIVGAKGNLKSCRVLGSSVSFGAMRGRFRFEFEDGSAFTVENSVRYNVSRYGQPFQQYPLTFHAVTLPDGSQLKHPSKERMDTVFVKTSGPEQRGPTPAKSRPPRP